MALKPFQVQRLSSGLLFFKTASGCGRLLHSKPAKHKVGPMETVIGFAVFSLAILGPAGWFLSHIQSYRMK